MYQMMNAKYASTLKSKIEPQERKEKDEIQGQTEKKQANINILFWHSKLKNN